MIIVEETRGGERDVGEMRAREKSLMSQNYIVSKTLSFCDEKGVAWEMGTCENLWGKKRQVRETG